MPEEKFKAALIEQAHIHADHSVLDFGCGSATLSVMAKEMSPGSKISGVDIDLNNIAIAKSKISEQGVEINIDTYDGVVLPYEDNSFDKVISSLVFHHLTAEQKINSLKEIMRVLKPGGELHIADWCKAKNAISRGAFYLVQILDGFETTTDNVKGLLPKFIKESGFDKVQETMFFNTIFGTLGLIKAIKAERL
ncbi:MAG: methyltransferase type 11 [Bacteroidetes bacterium]|nr:MAG: methyltransferase type 11 [Bacteroidota bacterium]